MGNAWSKEARSLGSRPRAAPEMLAGALSRHLRSPTIRVAWWSYTREAGQDWHPERLEVGVYTDSTIVIYNGKKRSSAVAPSLIRHPAWAASSFMKPYRSCREFLNRIPRDEDAIAEEDVTIVVYMMNQVSAGPPLRTM